MTPPIVIAIDGPSASGKSTNAKLVAQALDYVYVDTGAMYRTLTWYCRQHRIPLDNPKAVATACRTWKASLACVERQVHLLVDGQDPAREIRTQEISDATPQVAAVPKVRAWMRRKQRECARFGNLVMEGRDIGSHVFPETEFKFYLDASLDERVRRRQAEGRQENLDQRDRQDSQRAAAPLMIPLGAFIINNSGLTPAQSSARIVEEIRRRLAQAASPK